MKKILILTLMAFGALLPATATSLVADSQQDADAPELVRSVSEFLTVNGDRKCDMLGHGNIPPTLRTLECTAFGSLIADTLTISVDGRTLTPERDFIVDAQWSKFALTDSAGVAAGTQVRLQYSYRLRRVDALVRDADGNERWISGVPALNDPRAPECPPRTTLAATRFWDYNQVRDFPILQESAPSDSHQAVPLKIMQKILNGDPVKIVCWGDSVTAGAEAAESERYPAVLQRMLQERFPEADIHLAVIATPGSASTNWLWPEEYPFADADWARVEKAVPDLIVLEFVNDAGLDTLDAVQSQYGEILRRVRQLGAELILITPHFTHPAMMGFAVHDPWIHDPRGYVNALREFAKKNRLPLADASRRWEKLAGEGIPYVTWLRNSVNHPDERGHRIFAEEVMKCFQ